MTDPIPELAWTNMMDAWEILQADIHYTVGVFRDSSKSGDLPSHEVILNDLKTLKIHGDLHTSTENGYWLIVEPEQDVIVGQLNVIGLGRKVILGVWNYRNVPEFLFDSRELVRGIGSAADFVADNWWVIVCCLLAILGLVVYLVLRKR